MDLGDSEEHLSVPSDKVDDELAHLPQFDGLSVVISC
jgi:hypothetical protein